MSQLLQIQSDADPVEFTHFDCWDIEQNEGKPPEQVCEEVIKAWELSLNMTLHPEKRYNNIGLNLYSTIGVDGVLDLVIMAILEDGNYDVYASENFIEIYEAV